MINLGIKKTIWVPKAGNSRKKDTIIIQINIKTDMYL